MEFRKEQDEAQFLQAVMSTSHSAPRAETSELLFHVDAKLDHFKDRVESRNERFQEDLIRDINDLKAQVKRQSRRANIFALLAIVLGFTAAYFAIYLKVASQLENLVVQKTEHEFSTERIQSLISTEAEKFTKERAQLLIQSKMDTAIHDVDALKESVSTKLKSLEQLIESRRSTLEKAPDSAAPVVPTSPNN